MKRAKQKKNLWTIKSWNGHKNPWDPSEKVKETMVERIYGKGKFWACSGTEMHSENSERGDNDDDDDELVRVRWDDSDRDLSLTG